ncbi:insulinase family protein [Candidatus Saccharibacteria bacterium]|nr:insulinase family protein [Candidatus Saccharibacteria bacterium]
MRHTVEEIRLKNGAKGLLIDIPDATVMSFHFNFRAGNRYVLDKSKYETAHIMEHLAFGANAKFKDEHTYEAEFTKNGAYHNAFTGDVSMNYVAECADFEWDRILELQGYSITSPKFNQAELESEKGNVLSELTGCQNKYNRLLWPKIQQSLGEDILLYHQRIKTINNITLHDIKSHHARTHTANNLRFIVAGRLYRRKTQLRQILESWPLQSGEFFDMPTDIYQKSGPTLIRRKDASNLTFGWSTILPRRLTDAEDHAMSCLNHILTGTMYSRILGQARKKGLVYGTFSDTANGFAECAWDFGGEVNYSVAPELFKIITKEVQKILAGDINPADVEVAKPYALGRYQMGAQTVSQISEFYTGNYFTNGQIENYEKVPDMIKRVSTDQIIQIAREFMSADTWAFAAVGNCEIADLKSLNSQLETLYVQ